MKLINKIIPVFLIFLFVFSESYGQILEYAIHDRGELWETLFNTGDIGRGWQTGDAGNQTSVPLMEWPSRSATIVNGVKYSGQHNILGGGVYIAANPKGLLGKANRLYAMCGGVGASLPETVFERWSFPIYQKVTNNYPLLDDGTLNTAYNPDEAEQIIEASWSTPTGITVTRKSRQWSYPDYNDFIIYEYTFVYTGDTDGDLSTVEMTTQLNDVMFSFIYGFAPSMFGFQRSYQSWKYDAGIYRGDLRNFWDADYWLTYNMNLFTNQDSSLAPKAELDPTLFKLFSETGLNGGGLESPQAPGYCMLYYDYNHLAVVDPTDPAKNESEAVNVLRTSGGMYYELDENNHIKQPWSNKVSTGNTNSQKMMDQSINPDARWSGVYSPNSSTWPSPPVGPDGDPAYWIGRAAYPYRQSADAGQKHTVFGPYTLNIGDTVRFSLAEVVGYGAQAGKPIEGGQVTQQWWINPTWNKKIVINGQTMTNHYLDDYGYPDYVDSDVKNVTQVADKAFAAYLGHEPTLPVWPEKNPATGVYKIPIPVPSPIINLKNTAKADIEITWGRAVENFTAPRLTGTLAKFNIYRSESGMGPWKLLGSVVKGNVNAEGNYEFLDVDATYKISEERFYAVTSVDNNGNESGKTNITKFLKDLGAVEQMDKVYVVPNPFILKSGYTGQGNAQQDTGDRITFFGLPDKCTIHIFSYSGQLVQTINHDKQSNSHNWFQVTNNHQEIASGIYFYVVTDSNGKQSTGKFIIIK